MSNLRKMAASGKLRKIYEPLFERLYFCDICPRKCGVNRKLRVGVCGGGWKVKISNAILHFGEEPPLVGEGGSGTIFFSGCPMKCIYCQNMGFSQKGVGVEIEIEELAYIMLELQKAGAENINLVTATQYTPHVIKALEIASIEGLDLPIVWNTSGYERVNLLRSLDGVVDIYLSDIRYTKDSLGLKYSKVLDYWSVTRAALKEMYKQVGAFDGFKGLIVRVLVLPGYAEDHVKALEFVAKELSKDVPVSIMRQYMPLFNARKDPVLSRKVSDEEYNKVLLAAEELDLDGWYQLDKLQKVPTRAVESIYKLLKAKLTKQNY